MVTINGRQVEDADNISLKDYLAREGYEPARIAIEHNGEIVPREDFGRKQLRDGDVVEIINFVGGGAFTGRRASAGCGEIFTEAGGIQNG